MALKRKCFLGQLWWGGNRDCLLNVGVETRPERMPHKGSGKPTGVSHHRVCMGERRGG